MRKELYVLPECKYPLSERTWVPNHVFGAIPPQTCFQSQESRLRGNANPGFLNSIEEQIFPAIQCNAVYESVYLLGTSLARP